MFLLNEFKNRYTKEMLKDSFYRTNNVDLKKSMKYQVDKAAKKSKGFTDNKPNLKRQDRITQLKDNLKNKKLQNNLNELFDNQSKNHTLNNTKKTTKVNMNLNLDENLKKATNIGDINIEDIVKQSTKKIPNPEKNISSLVHVPQNSNAKKSLLSKLKQNKKLALLGSLAVGGGLLANKIRKDRKKRKDKGILRGKYKL